MINGILNNGVTFQKRRKKNFDIFTNQYNEECLNIFNNACEYAINSFLSAKEK